MSWFWGTPRAGDWVASTRTIPVTLTDHLLGGDAGIPPGTRGVITRNLGWNALEVRFDTGLFGAVTARVKPAQVRLARRGGGIEAFERRSARLNAARAGVAVALIAPLAYFVVSWFIQGGTKEGLVGTLLEGVLYGIFDLLEYALANPVDALLYVGLVALAGRFAFRA